jgi:hypothetical protein
VQGRVRPETQIEFFSETHTSVLAGTELIVFKTLMKVSLWEISVELVMVVK